MRRCAAAGARGAAPRGSGGTQLRSRSRSEWVRRLGAAVAPTGARLRRCVASWRPLVGCGPTCSAFGYCYRQCRRPRALSPQLGGWTAPGCHKGAPLLLRHPSLAPRVSTICGSGSSEAVIAGLWPSRQSHDHGRRLIIIGLFPWPPQHQSFSYRRWFRIRILHCSQSQQGRQHRDHWKRCCRSRHPQLPGLELIWCCLTQVLARRCWYAQKGKHRGHGQNVLGEV